MIRSVLKQRIKSAIHKKFGKIEIPAFTVSVSENAEHGDYATNVAFVLAKLLNKPPMEIARQMASGAENQELWKTTVAAPGFINFHLSHRMLEKEFSKILIMGKNYGKEKRNKRKIQLEFISANPTGPLTLANGRGGFYGDVLSRILERQGCGVEREYYINDAGDQIQTLGNSVIAATGKISDREEYYHGEYIKEWAAGHQKVVEDMHKQNLSSVLGRIVAEDLLKNSIRPSIEKKMKVRFKRWTSEYRHILDRGYVEKVLSIFREQEFSYESGGALWLKTTEFGDDKDRVLITSDKFKSMTYFLVDSGHYLETKKRGFDQKINIVGADHHGYVSRIQATAKILKLSSVVIVMQMVRLVSDGKEVRMSKRKGTYITIDELIDEVGVDAARYFFLEKSPDTHMDFDLGLAKEKSVKNPVYYIQYAFVRCRGILQKTQSIKFKTQTKDKKRNKNLLNTMEETNLVKKLIQFPEVVGDIAKDYQVHRLPRYAYELAHSFHNFYEKHRVITDDERLTRARIELVRAVRIVLGNTLTLMGISAPEKM